MIPTPLIKLTLGLLCTALPARLSHLALQACRCRKMRSLERWVSRANTWCAGSCRRAAPDTCAHGGSSRGSERSAPKATPRTALASGLAPPRPAAQRAGLRPVLDPYRTSSTCSSWPGSSCTVTCVCSPRRSSLAPPAGCLVAAAAAPPPPWLLVLLQAASPGPPGGAWLASAAASAAWRAGLRDQRGRAVGRGTCVGCTSHGV